MTKENIIDLLKQLKKEVHGLIKNKVRTHDQLKGRLSNVFLVLDYLLEEIKRG